ncbi:MAG: phage tail tape measure protein [Synergistaceae bacterium]|nr:phage tail tape measure protein [Synergistaceae bacterium]
MAKTVEVMFSIGATLTGGFNNTFGKAGQAIAELQKQTSNLHKASGQINAYQKMQDSMSKTSEKLNLARAKVKELGLQMRNTAAPTEAMKRQFTAANIEANRLQTSLGDQRKKLSELRTELHGAGVDTKNLTSEQARLTAQSQKFSEAQNRLQNSRAALAATRQQLSWSNITGELMTAAGLGYSLYKPVSQAADFEQAMARVNAVAFSGGGRDKEADAKAFKALQEQARQLGRDTQFTATQAAQSQENLARAGFKSNEIISAMPGLLNMAAAEGMDLAQAADITASTLRGFNLNADQSNRVADVLAQTSAASNTSIAGLGESMKMCAPFASGLGVSIEQTAAMLGAMANAGIKGAESGTALRNAFMRLSQEPKAVEKALKKLGIASRDAEGNMRELPEIMLALHKKIKDYGKADQAKYLADIFGARAVSGMMAVMNAAVDGSLQELEYFNKESNGIMTAIIDSFSKGASKITLDEMRAGMKNAEPYARKLGISYKDLSVYLAVLNANSMKGVKVDEALTEAFNHLATKPKEVQKALKQFNLSAYDKDGRLRDFPKLLKEIGEATKNLQGDERIKAIENIFGKNTGHVLLTMINSMDDGIYEKFDAIADKATGVSKEMSDKVKNTMRGAWIQASSAFEGLMLTIGDVLLPTVTKAVTAFKDFTSWIGKLAHENPAWTEAIVGTVGALAAFKVGLVGLKIGWNLIKLPFQSLKVAFDLLHVKALLGAQGLTEAGKKAGLFSRAAKGLSNGAKGIGKALMSMGKGIGSFFKNMFNMGKNLISGLFSPMGLKILAIAAIIATVAALAYLVYKNWDKIKEWWDSWTIKDIFAALKGYASSAWSYVKKKWKEFWEWWDSWSLADIFAPVIQFADDCLNKLKGLWQSFKDWLIGLFDFDLFSSFKVPSLSTEQVEAAKTEIKAKHGTLDLTPSYMKAFAAGGFVTSPEIALIGEAGREAVIPLEDKSRGIPLWKAAGEEMGLRFGNSTTNNDNRTRSVVLSPSFNITVNSGEQGIEQKFRQIIEDVLENLRNDMERVSFA